MQLIKYLIKPIGLGFENGDFPSNTLEISEFPC